MVLESTPYTTWNMFLRKKAEGFAMDHPGTTNLLFSAWETFNRVIENPEDYGFSSADVRLSGGKVWFDMLHPTSGMHKIISKDISTFLQGVPAYKENDSSSS
jgi:hypothetical protein